MTNAGIKSNQEPDRIRERLIAEAESGYQEFASRLIPGVKNLLRVRLPVLRRISREIAKNDWRFFLSRADLCSFEETMLCGMVIGVAKMEEEERIKHIRWLIPKIDNWSVCDSFCAGLKTVRNNRAFYFPFLAACLKSSHEYTVRFAAVMLRNYYVVDEYIDVVLSLLAKTRHDGYYARMAVAWAVSECFVFFPALVEEILSSGTLCAGTQRMAVRKIRESRRKIAQKG